MNVKRGIYKTQDGIFKTSYDGTKHYKEVREYEIIVVDFNGIEMLLLSQIKNENHVTIDMETIDHIENERLGYEKKTRDASTFIGSNIDDIQYRVTLGLVEPVTEWVTPLTELTQ